MFPGMGGVNPAQMKSMMKKMGINQDELDVSRVIIEKTDGGKIIVEPAQVQKITMKGQENFQVSGEIREESGEVKMDEDDVKLVVEKTGKSEDEVRKVLEETKDVAETIMRLS
jgi:nascent polypeptide-associated complex subunit alpha